MDHRGSICDGDILSVGITKRVNIKQTLFDIYLNLEYLQSIAFRCDPNLAYRDIY